MVDVPGHSVPEKQYADLPPLEELNRRRPFRERLYTKGRGHQTLRNEPLSAQSRGAGTDCDQVCRHIIRDRGNSSAVRTQCENRCKQQDPSQMEKPLATDFSVRGMTSRNTLAIGT